MSHARTHLVRLGAAALASAATLATVAGAAGAAISSGGTGNSGASAIPATLDQIRARAAGDITDRVDALHAAIAEVEAARGLGSGQSTLVSFLGADVSPLQQLNQKIQGDTTVKQAAHDLSTIFSGFRVYVLVLPAARIAADADRVTTTVLPALTADAAKAQSHMNQGSQGELQPLIDDLNHQIGTATNATNGLAATVLAFTPVQWDDNHDLLSGSRSSDQTADAAVAMGRADVGRIVQDLTGPAAGGATTG
jgi:hypothetical protein